MRLITWFLFPNFVAVWCCVHRKSSIIEIDSLELKLDGLEVDSLELFTSSIVHSPWIALGGGAVDAFGPNKQKTSALFGSSSVSQLRRERSADRTADHRQLTAPPEKRNVTSERHNSSSPRFRVLFFIFFCWGVHSRADAWRGDSVQTLSSFEPKMKMAPSRLFLAGHRRRYPIKKHERRRENEFHRSFPHNGAAPSDPFRTRNALRIDSEEQQTTLESFILLFLLPLHHFTFKSKKKEQSASLLDAENTNAKQFSNQIQAKNMVQSVS